MFDIPVVTDSTLKRSCFVEITAKIILSKCYEPTLTNQTICTQWTTSNIIIIAFIFKARGSGGGSRKVAKTQGGEYNLLEQSNLGQLPIEWFKSEKMDPRMVASDVFWSFLGFILVTGIRTFDNLPTLEQFYLMDDDSAWRPSTQKAKAK